MSFLPSFISKILLIGDSDLCVSLREDEAVRITRLLDALLRPLPLLLGPNFLSFVFDWITEVRAFVVARCCQRLEPIGPPGMVVFVLELVVFEDLLIRGKEQGGS